MTTKTTKTTKTVKTTKVAKERADGRVRILLDLTEREAAMLYRVVGRTNGTALTELWQQLGDIPRVSRLAQHLPPLRTSEHIIDVYALEGEL